MAAESNIDYLQKQEAGLDWQLVVICILYRYDSDIPLITR
jgi:hypothetical protein